METLTKITSMDDLFYYMESAEDPQEGCMEFIADYLESDMELTPNVKGLFSQTIRDYIAKYN